MITHALIQSTPEWHAYRRTHFNASDAPAMLGVSAYKTRSQLLQERHTGLCPEVDPATQRRFNDGHRFEALARPLAEKIIGQDLYPVTGSNGNLSASFDGLVMDESIAWEHKTLNKELRAVLTVAPEMADHEAANAIIPLHYRVQMQQQCMVSGAACVLFMASTWDGDTLVEARHCWYESDAKLAADINAGWEQFDIDLAAYVPAAVVVAPVAAAITALPAVSVQVTGSIAIKDNFAVFEVALKDFIEHRLIRKPETDQDFADLDTQIKALKGAEAALDALEAQMLSQVEAVDLAKRTKDMLLKLARDNRLMAEKLLAARKEQIKGEIVAAGIAALREHFAALNTRLGKPYMPAVQADFAGAAKGKRTIQSLHDAVDTELARAKIETSAIADKIQINLTTLRELATAHAFLFADASAIVLKAPDDLAMLVKTRIAEHQAAELAKEEATRERIRAEEQAKAEAAARVKLLAEQETERLAVEAAKPVVAPVAAPSANVVPLRAAPAIAATSLPTLKLGQIGERLGFALTGDFLKSLGFEPAARANNAVLFHESSFTHICAALVDHINTVQARQAA
jgi:putative phage-type endonuclease